jgi:uncharacterized protein
MELLQPLEKQNRIRAVDALRGLALLGILLANVPYADNPANTAAGQINDSLSFLFHLLIEKKYITIFSIFFGSFFPIFIMLSTKENPFARRIDH